MAVKNEGFPDLERYLEERGRHLVTYTEGATMYHIPYYSFVRLAKEAGANLPLRRTVMIEVMNDVDIDPMDGILHHAEGVDVLPANIELSGLEVALVNVMSREVILKTYIEMIRDQYDVVLVDCMPSLGMMNINALAAADEVIIPCSASYLPVKGLEQLMATIVKVKKHLNRKLRIRGIVMTMTDFRTNYAKDIAEMIRSGYGSKVGIFKTTIPFSVKAAEPSAEGVSVYKHCPGGKVANAFADLTKEVLG